MPFQITCIFFLKERYYFFFFKREILYKLYYKDIFLFITEIILKKKKIFMKTMIFLKIRRNKFIEQKFPYFFCISLELIRYEKYF